MLVSPHHLAVLGIAPWGTLDIDQGPGSHSLVLLRILFIAFMSSLIFLKVSSPCTTIPLSYTHCKVWSHLHHFHLGLALPCPLCCLPYFFCSSSFPACGSRASSFSLGRAAVRLVSSVECNTAARRNCLLRVHAFG